MVHSSTCSFPAQPHAHPWSNLTPTLSPMYALYFEVLLYSGIDPLLFSLRQVEKS